MACSNCVIPSDLIGNWGSYVKGNPLAHIRINADGSGNLSTLNDGRWIVNENRIEFRKFHPDCPLFGSALYSIIDGKLFFSEPLEGDIDGLFRNLMPPYLQSGLEKIV